MHIFIDESGPFIPGVAGRPSISLVASLVVPDFTLSGVEKNYKRLRRSLTKVKGEVKGRSLSEKEINSILSILKRFNCLIEIVAIDMAINDELAVTNHKLSQSEIMVKNLTEEHSTSLRAKIHDLKNQLENTPNQLYIQSVCLSELVYHTINHSDLYYCTRRPQELGQYVWAIDAKNSTGPTKWERWWSDVVMPMIESKSIRNPMMALIGGDYRWHERFFAEPSAYKRQFFRSSRNARFTDVGMIMQENMTFSSESLFGLELVDVIANCARRALSGNLQREGWIQLPKLMIHRPQHYIQFVSLDDKDYNYRPPYMKVLRDFETGGRPIIPSAN